MSDGHTQAGFDTRIARTRKLAFDEMATWSDRQVNEALRLIKRLFKKKATAGFYNALTIFVFCIRSGFNCSWAEVLVEEEQRRRLSLKVPPAPPSSPV